MTLTSFQEDPGFTSDATFATNHDEAAANCNTSAAFSMPYKKTLTIQHTLATVWPSHSKRSMRVTNGTDCFDIVKNSLVRHQLACSAKAVPAAAREVVQVHPPLPVGLECFCGKPK